MIRFDDVDGLTHLTRTQIPRDLQSTLSSGTAKTAASAVMPTERVRPSRR
jgi:hypothetical protein